MALPTAPQVIAIFQEIIDLLGFDAFMHKGWAQFYSGPNNEILKELFGHTAKELAKAKRYKSNNPRSFRQAKHLSAARLDDTKVGKMIAGMKIYEFFISRYPHAVMAGVHEADEVMRFLSREYTKAAFGNVATAVCGGARDRVFRDTELALLMANTGITKINGVEHRKFKTIYESKSISRDEAEYKTFRLICLTELRFLRARAISTRKLKVVDDYLDRREFYRLARKERLEAMGKAVPAIYSLSPTDRIIKRAELKTSILAATATTRTAMVGRYKRFTGRRLVA